MEGLVRQLVRSLLAYAAQRDISPETLSTLSGIILEDLHTDTATLTRVQMDQLWANAVHLSKDPLFGLHFGESLQLSALGIVGSIIKSSATVGGALSIAASLTHFITADFSLELEQTPEAFKARFIPLRADWMHSIAAVQTLDLLMVFLIHELDGLVLKKIRPQSVHYSRSVEDSREYDRVMRCKVEVSAKENEVSFDNKYWNEPIITANYEMQSLLLQKAAELKLIGPDKDSLKVRIYNYLLANSYLGMVSLEDIALNFNLSTRTLQRRLREEGVSFHQLSDEVRKILALNYLKGGSYPVKEISYMLGYNELSAFSRTFKRWTGTTPASYQKLSAASSRSLSSEA